jgi:hypothetical protein
MSRRGLRIVLAGLALATTSVHMPARAVRFRCPSAPVEMNLAVVFGNGMFTDVGRARDNLDALRDPVVDLLGVSEAGIEWDLAYNFSEGLALQLWEVVQQRLFMTSSHYVRVLAGLTPMPEAMREIVAMIAASIDVQGFYQEGSELEDDLERQLLVYESHLARGRSVLVVAHSQGALYANGAYSELLRRGRAKALRDNFAIVAVATPAPDVLGRAAPECATGCYTTLHDDFVISAARGEFPTTLPATTRDRTEVDDWLKHSFLEVYMELESTRTRILGHISAQVESFPELEAEHGTGPITATLSWTDDADLDLHVYERDGRAHVYHAVPEGFAGYLDRDSRNASQPESYFATCERLQEGTYEIGVNYYAGTGPALPSVLVTAGSLQRSFRRLLPEARGQAGDRDPEPLGWIIVTQPGVHTFDFELFPNE